jgi:hypothetical protein
MTNSTQFTCDACGESIIHESRQRYMPPEWGVKGIEGTVYCLCPTCGGRSEGRDISPNLCERLARRGIKIQECELRWGITPSSLPSR